tara:strand:- start:2432 stop:2659 length:228 start_codon:yes stop_codon:yes gene_type:complete
MKQSTLLFNEQPFKGRGSLTKQEVCDAYKFSMQTLGRLLNHQYYVVLAELGYVKKSSILPPKVVNKFIELYGEPL